MAKILFYPNDPLPSYVWYDDPRPAREVMYLVNTGRLRMGIDLPIDHRQPQTAMSLPEHDMVTVCNIPQYIELTDAMYCVVFGMLDGLPEEQIAQSLGITPKSLRALQLEICQRFRVKEVFDIPAAAHLYGIE